MNIESMYDPMTMLHMVAEDREASHAFKAQSFQEARLWQIQTRSVLRQMLSIDRFKQVAVKSELLESVECEGYTRRKYRLATGEGIASPVYVLIPKNTTAPLPTVVALHGHGYGVKDIVGLWEDGRPRLETDGYQQDFGCMLARAGFLVVAPEISCFGERHSNVYHPDESRPEFACHRVGLYSLMLGIPVLGLRVWDAMRILDFVESLDIADHHRIATMGISGGGMVAFFLTALDCRVKASVISGYFCNWRHSILAMKHCLCNYVPGIMSIGELSDFAGLIAPRYCMIEHGVRDNSFPIDAVRYSTDRAKRAWKVLGKESDLELCEFEGRHRIDGARALEFLKASMASIGK